MVSVLLKEFSISGGTIVRGEEEGRIEFLAKVRNKALEPLWNLEDMSSEQARGVGHWRADRIIFMNDVFFCAKDVVRLLLHEVDMACALDFGNRDEVSLQ